MSTAAPCNSAAGLTRGVFNANASDVAHAWTPSGCSLRNAVRVGSSMLCEALEKSGIRRVLLLGESHVRILFVILVHALLPPQTAEDTALLPGSSKTYCNPSGHSFGGSLGSNRFGTAQLLNMLCYCKEQNLPPIKLDGSGPADRTVCTFARRCGGKLEVDHWQLPDAFASSVFKNNLKERNYAPKRLPVASVLNASLVQRANAAAPFDAVILNMNGHYQKGYAPVPWWYASEVFADDIVQVADAIQEHLQNARNGLATVRPAVFLTTPRQYQRRKPPRWREQTPCAIADLNAIAAYSVRARAFRLLDLFELTTGLEHEHSMDGTHFDADVYQAMVLLLLEVLTQPSSGSVEANQLETGRHGSLADSKPHHSHDSSDGQRAAARGCQMRVRWSRETSVSNDSHTGSAQWKREDDTISASIQDRCNNADGGAVACGFVPSPDWFGSSETALVEHTCHGDCSRHYVQADGACSRMGRVQRVHRSISGNRSVDAGQFFLKAIHNSVLLSCPIYGGDATCADDAHMCVVR